MSTVERLATALADRYRIERELGAGGMATVYLAEDLKHKRRVAVKVLKPELAAVLGADRFIQEITTTAALQHPHILPLFDSGDADGFLFYVMPFIDGETLRAKLNRETQLGVDEAVKIASDVADALHYAHTQGVVHRDIKPENILLANGRPMVADFGIALAVSAAAGGRMTETGLSLGTPHYMSPEQATAEKEIGARSDVYSLASVLYEMLAGQPPHLGGSAQQIIMKIITEQPQDVTVLRKSVPPNVAAAIAKALEKLPSDRFATAQDFAHALADRAFRHGEEARAGVPAGVGGSPRQAAVMAFAIVSVGVLGVWLGASRRDAPGRSESAGALRFTMDLPYDSAVAPLPAGMTSLAISPDGRTVVAVGGGPGGESQLFVRRVDELAWRALPGTAQAEFPFISPDGEWVGFKTGIALMKMRINGGNPIELGRFLTHFLTPPTWGTGDRIVIPLRGRLVSIQGGGGAVRLLPMADSGSVQQGQVAPVMLDDEYVLFSHNTGNSDGEIVVASLESGDSHVLTVRGRPIAVVDGILVFLDGQGVLSAVRFDDSARRVVGDPIRFLRPNIAGARTDRGIVAVSRTGALIYQGGVDGTHLVMRDVAGRTRPLLPTVQGADPRLSPDGQRVAVESGRDIWVLSVAGDAAPQRLTADSVNMRPEWTPDGSRVLYRSERGGHGTLRIKSVDGGSADETLLALEGREIWQGVFSPDESTILFRTGTEAGADIWVRAVAGDTTLVPVAATAFEEHSPRFSPDGRWIAYVSTESGGFAVYIRRFPIAGTPIRVSLAHGAEPIWSRDGRALYYRAERELIRANLRTEPSLAVTTREVIFPDFFSFGGGRATYDVAPGGREFVMNRGVSEGAHLVFVHDWLHEVRARLARRP